jgi:hypothetical protein
LPVSFWFQIHIKPDQPFIPHHVDSISWHSASHRVDQISNC